MDRTRIAVFVSGGGTNLEAILKEAEAGNIPHGEIALVISSKPGVYALERAANHGIPAEVVSRKQDPDHFEERIEALLGEYRIGMIVLAGFLSILSPSFTDRWDGRIINVHPALIPSFCGAGFYGLKVHEAALQKGVKVTGATVHFVNEIPDGGEILFQKAVRVQPGDTPELLQRRVMEQAEWKLLPRAAELVSREIVSQRKQETYTV